MRTTTEQPITIICPYDNCTEPLTATLSTTTDGPDHKGRIDIFLNIDDVGNDAMNHWNNTHAPPQRNTAGDYLPKAGITAWPGQHP